MVSNIPINSQNYFNQRDAEKVAQRAEQIQDRQNNCDFVRSPAASGLARPIMITPSFGRR